MVGLIEHVLTSFFQLAAAAHAAADLVGSSAVVVGAVSLSPARLAAQEASLPAVALASAEASTLDVAAQAAVFPHRHVSLVFPST